MKSGHERFEKKFDEIDEKIGLMMAEYRTLQLKNREMGTTISRLEAELETLRNTKNHFSEQDAFIQSRMEGLLKKLDEFSDSP